MFYYVDATSDEFKKRLEEEATRRGEALTRLRQDLKSFLAMMDTIAWELVELHRYGGREGWVEPLGPLVDLKTTLDGLNGDWYLYEEATAGGR